MRWRTAITHGALVLACAAGAVACGGGERITKPDEQVIDTGVVSVVIEPPADSVRAYDQVVLSANAYDRNGHVREKAIAWRVTDNSVATIAADGKLEALRHGMTNVIASVDDAADTLELTVSYAPAASLTVAPRQLLIGSGRIFSPAVTARDIRGAPAGQVLELIASTGNVAIEGQAIRAVSAGSATVYVRVGTLVDSVTVSVRDGFPFAQNTFALARQGVIELYGDAVGAAHITVNGADATTQVIADTLVRYTVPAAPFAPCKPAGTVELSVSRPSGVVRTTLPSLSAPLSIALVPGAHAFVPEVITTGCEIAVADAGEYLIMPFSWDRTNTYGSYAPGGPIAARLSVGAPVGAAAGASTVSPLVARSAFTGRTAIAVPDRARSLLQGDVLDYGGNLSTAAGVEPTMLQGPVEGTSCPIPITVGETVPIGTERSGGIVQLALRGSPTENWTLVAITPHLAVFFDTTMVRVATGNAAVSSRLAKFVAAYDSTVIPLLNSYTTGIPDADGNGRVVLLLPYRPTGGFAYAMPNGYGRPDCTYGAAGGEAFFMPSNIVLTNPILNLPTAMAFAAHETAHLVDLKGSLADREYTAWSSEGFAMQFNWLWAAGPTVIHPYSGNRSTPFIRLLEGEGTGYSCVEPARTTWTALYSGSQYTGPCAMVRAIVSRGVGRGLSVRDALMRFVGLSHRYTFASSMNEYEGTSRPAPEIVGEWLLMWFADDYVAGTAGALQDPAMNWRTAYSLGFPLPEQTLSPGSQVDLTMGEPDVHHYVAELPAQGRIGFTQPAGFTTELAKRASLALLRVR